MALGRPVYPPVRVTFTGYQQTILLADIFPGITFDSTDEFIIHRESGQGSIINPGDVTTTSIKVTNVTSPSGDTVMTIYPLKSAT